MKPRIEKKLSKKLCEVAPNLMKGAWVDNDIMESAYDNGTCVSNVMSMGDGIDYWGEGEEVYTCWEFFLDRWVWLFRFPVYPEGHEFEMYPDTRGFKPTTINLLKLAAQND